MICFFNDVLIIVFHIEIILTKSKVLFCLFNKNHKRFHNKKTHEPQAKNCTFRLNKSLTINQTTEGM